MFHYGNNSHMHMFLNDIMVDLLRNKEEIIYFEGNVEELPIFKTNKFQVIENGISLTTDDIIEQIKAKYYKFIFPDIITIYKIFSGRRICQQYPNYAKQLTKDYFNYIITQLNSPSLYLYLISNAIILNHELSVKQALNDFNKLPAENIKQYSERVKDEINAYIYDIKNTIENF